MEILKKLFKSKKPTYRPQNRLETLLQEAVSRPELRGEFYSQIFHFELYVLGEIGANSEGQKIAQFETRQNKSGKQNIYAFSSRDALQFFVDKYRFGDQKYITLGALEFFELIPEETNLIINLGLPFGVELSGWQIKQILNDNAGGVQEYVVAEGNTFKFGVPSHIPKGLVEILSRFIAHNKELANIYLSLCLKGDSDWSYFLLLDLNTKLSSPKLLLNNLGVALAGLRLVYPVDIGINKERFQQIIDQGAFLKLI